MNSNNTQGKEVKQKNDSLHQMDPDFGRIFTCGQGFGSIKPDQYAKLEELAKKSHG